LLIRFHRMKGYRTLWLPGTDHAAIATQNAVEKLLKEKNVTRQDLGREKFLEEVWKFLEETKAEILHQTRKMGASLDWSREAFTLDEQRKKVVKKMFVDMYKEGVIYQGERIVNWCSRCQSTLADDELEHKEQKAKLYTFKYDKNFPVSIATTRPETKLGDTAVAVNPKDKRYKKLIGKIYEVDFIGVPLKIKIIADSRVDVDFGTGALGVTPAHSMIDWEMAEKNNLKVIKVIGEEGKIKPGFGKFSGKIVSEVRNIIINHLKNKELLESEEEIVNNLSVCYRCGTAIEQIPSKQWFVAVNKKVKKLGNKSLKEKALETAKSKKIKFIPFRFTKRYIDWMTNLHDWCISRQIWFGHEIPVWYKEGKTYVEINPPKENGWIQDQDTLDTWFSSGMWTFSTLNWPDTFKNGKKTGDLARFHPTQVLETGYDILTLWVSRMIMMTLFALDEIPFENVYLHGLILDKTGKKMSKSKGNGIDPLDMINKFGTDSVRLALLMGATPGNDIRMSEDKVTSFRNFVTKLWNIYRYSTSSAGDLRLIDQIDKKEIKTLADEWVVSRLNSVICEITRNIDNFKFSLAGEELQRFTWDELADWYLEIHKIEKNDKVLGYVLDKILKLWHPFMPFVTEKIWQDLYNGRKMLMVEKWPSGDKKMIDKKAEKEFEDLREIIAKIRNLRSSYHINPSEIIKASAEKINNREIIEKLARIKFEKKKIKGIMVAGKNINLVLDISDIIDVKKESERLKKEIKNLGNLILKTEFLVKNKKFLASAPAEIINANLVKVNDYRDKLSLVRQLLTNLKNL